MKLRHDAPHTSVQAACLAYPKAGTGRARILTLLSCHPDDGLTDAQIQDMLRLAESSERPRRVELVEQGWVEASGRERVYAGHGAAIVWVLTGPARSELLNPRLFDLSKAG